MRRRGSSFVFAKLVCLVVNWSWIPTLRGASALIIKEIRNDDVVMMNGEANFTCVYDLEGDSLYSVKWFKKGEKEIYRYLPQLDPPNKAFDYSGFRVDLNLSNNQTLWVKGIGLEAAGEYRCEVSAEAPSFQTNALTFVIEVNAVPVGDPVIFGGSGTLSFSPSATTSPAQGGGRTYALEGEDLRFNCTTGPSWPAAKLKWYINGKLAPTSMLRSYPPQREADGRITTVLGLRIGVNNNASYLSGSGDLKLKCSAAVGSKYFRTREETVLLPLLHHKPPHEIRQQARPDYESIDMPARGASWNGCTTGLPEATVMVLCSLALLSIHWPQRQTT